MSSASASVCPVCGGSLLPNAIECPHCGERLSDRALPGDAYALRQELAALHASRKHNNLLGFAFGVPGLLLQVVGAALSFSEEIEPTLALVLLGLRVLGLILLAVGMYYVALYKGRNGAWALLAMIGCIGLVVMLVLKDYNRQRIKQIEAALGAPAT